MTVLSATSTPQVGTAPTPGAIANTFLAPIQAVVQQELQPQVCAIDAGEYPKAVMHQLGTAGAFAQAVAPDVGGTGRGLLGAIQSLEVISETCLSTGFMAWCQIACTWYLQNTTNQALKQQWLPQVAAGTVLAGTGLSNPMKHFAAIEKIALTAERVDGGYRLNGLLPWVSNLGPGHLFGVAARMVDATTGKPQLAPTGDDRYLMAVVSDDMEGMTLRGNAHFIGMEGTNTYSCLFRDVFVADEWILAAPCEDYVETIRPGFILTQVGMGLGLVSSCVDLIERSNRRLGHVNEFLEDGADQLAMELEAARQQTYVIASALDANGGKADLELTKEVVRTRIAGSELSLRAAQSTMLHLGARAYLQGCDAERKLREAYFVAIVTPALKHLKKLLHALESQPAT